jgi:hypothetical protein
VLALTAELIVAVEGPLVCFQIPAFRLVPGAGVAVLLSMVELPGNVIDCAAPISTTGKVLAGLTLVVFPGLGLTVTVTEELAVCPRLLVA